MTLVLLQNVFIYTYLKRERKYVIFTDLYLSSQKNVTLFQDRNGIKNSIINSKVCIGILIFIGLK